MADQLRHDVLGCFGGHRLLPAGAPAISPRLDTLASMSACLDRHFTPAPLCVPARSCLMTGRYSHHHGAVINGWLPGERPFGCVRGGVPFLPGQLQQAGYRVAHVGVQHVRAEPDFPTRNPGVTFIGPAGLGEHRAALAARGLSTEDPEPFRDPVVEFDNGRPVVLRGSNPQVGLFPLVEEHYLDSVIADRLVETIHGHGRGPLALFGMFWLPHPPLVAPRAWIERYDAGTLNLPANVGKWVSSTPALQLANFPGQVGAHVSAEHWRFAWAAYLGMVALLDACVGRVLAALDHAGMLEDSLIVFTSDHGEMLGSRRLFQKMCLYEEAVRVPTIIKPPGSGGGRRTTELTNHLDLHATLLSAAGVELEPTPGGDGRDLLPLSQGAAHRHASRDATFARYDGNAGRAWAHRMVRTRSHKLIVNDGDTDELYDLVEDPRESVNLIGRPASATVERELRQRLAAWATVA